MSDKKLLSKDEAAARLNLSPTTLADWRCKGIGPTFVKLNGAVRYIDGDIDEYIRAAVESLRTRSNKRGRPMKPTKNNDEINDKFRPD